MIKNITLKMKCFVEFYLVRLGLVLERTVQCSHRALLKFDVWSSLFDVWSKYLSVMFNVFNVWYFGVRSKSVGYLFHSKSIFLGIYFFQC